MENHVNTNSAEETTLDEAGDMIEVKTEDFVQSASCEDHDDGDDIEEDAPKDLKQLSGRKRPLEDISLKKSICHKNEKVGDDIDDGSNKKSKGTGIPQKGLVDFKPWDIEAFEKVGYLNIMKYLWFSFDQTNNLIFTL